MKFFPLKSDALPLLGIIEFVNTLYTYISHKNHPYINSYMSDAVKNTMKAVSRLVRFIDYSLRRNIFRRPCFVIIVQRVVWKISDL